jgi:hypothetical protein
MVPSVCLLFFASILLFASQLLPASLPLLAFTPLLHGATVTAVVGVPALDDGLLLLAMQSKLPEKHGIAPLNSP